MDEIYLPRAEGVGRAFGEEGSFGFGIRMFRPGRGVVAWSTLNVSFLVTGRGEG